MAGWSPTEAVDMAFLQGVDAVHLLAYGVLLAAAYLLGLKLAMSRAQTRGLDGARVLDLGIYIIISALVGAKLLLLIVEFDTFRQNPRELITLMRAEATASGRDPEPLELSLGHLDTKIDSERAEKHAALAASVQARRYIDLVIADLCQRGCRVIEVDGVAVALRLESHNHPSAIEPFQGAATGVGGIHRDIFTMGARPIALMDPLRSGPAQCDAKTRCLPSFANATTSYRSAGVPGISIPGDPTGIPGTPIPATFAANAFVFESSTERSLSRTSVPSFTRRESADLSAFFFSRTDRCGKTCRPSGT
mgnify:CR=1 FL=1